MKVTVVSRSGREVVKGGIELSDSVCLFFFPLNFLLVFFVNFIVVMVVLNFDISIDFGELGFIYMAENFPPFCLSFQLAKGDFVFKSNNLWFIHLFLCVGYYSRSAGGNS